MNAFLPLLKRFLSQFFVQLKRQAFCQLEVELQLALRLFMSSEHGTVTLGNFLGPLSYFVYLFELAFVVFCKSAVVKDT
jgi:hypothetical protein